MHCTNINHQQIQDWSKEFSKTPEYIGAIVSLWQESNNRLDEFPSKLWMENQLSDNTTDIKPGIQELFESNPELANAVYEALGFDNLITPNDKIIWGHPAIGKSYAAKKVKMIDFDSYKLGINKKYNLYIAPGLSDTELRTDDKTREARENWRYESEENQALWNQFIRDVWQQAKKDAKEQGAILFASDLLVLREFGNEVDKALTMSDELFFERSKQRNNFIEGELGTKVWKGNLNIAVNNFKEKFGEDKAISTEKYLSDLFITPEQKQQAQQQYSQYLEQNPNGNVEQFKNWLDNNQSNVQYQLPQGREQEEFVASEKTIRDLAARMSDRIGIPVRFESDRSKEYKGKIENNVAYVNLAYATLDTPIHEILGHPIIRAIKNTAISERKGFNLSNFEIKKDYKNNTWYIDFKPGYYREEFKSFLKTGFTNRKLAENSLKNNYSELYQNLLKELETGKGKEVLDRIKRDYVSKGKKAFENKVDIEGFLLSIGKLNEKLKLSNGEYIKENDGKIVKIQRKGFTETINLSEKESENYFNLQQGNEKFYSLEEQQEEAVVELLGLMTAEKLDNVEDGKLISILKRLLKEIKAFMRDILFQKEVEIDKLPDNMTLGDLSDLLAYSNSKLILPGYEVEYTTPDNNKFKTYIEASNHISELARNVEDVNLDKNISVDNIDKEIEILQKELDNFKFEIEPFNKFTDVYTKKGRLRQNYWARKKDGTTGWTGGSKETLIEPEYDGFVLDTDRGDGRFITKISDKEAEELYYAEENKFNTTTKASREKYAELETKIHNLKNNSLKGFIEKNKEYEQSKEIIEEWKKVNNIQYNPEEIYSRGQEFSSVVGAYSNFDVNLMMQNLLSHIEDNEKAGGKFAISAYTKPIDKQIGHLEGGGGKIKFKINPKSEDILWAANTDVYSGSVWDASEKVNKNKKSELLGVSYTKYPALHNVNAVQPNLASIVEDLAHHHNELGITLTGNNFRLEYDDNIPYTTKKIIDGINKILDQKYGKLVKPEINVKNREGFKVYFTDAYGNSAFSNPNFNTREEAQAFIDEKKDTDISFKIVPNKGIQPTQTNETLKESINSVKDSILKDSYKEIKGWGLVVNDKTINNKEYNSQALINTKIAALKEVAKKYPRSLIRSEVKRQTNSFGGYVQDQDLFPDDLLFQKIQSNDITESNNFLLNLGKQNGIKDDTFKENDWSEEVNTLVTQQYEHISTTFEQKRNCEKLMSFSSDLSGSTEKNYILKNNTVLERASTVIKKDERFKFDDDKFDESKYDDNKIWGNQIDDILRSVIQFRFDEDQTKNVLFTIEKLRNKRGEENQINEEITNKLIYEFNNFLKQNPNKVAIPQVFLYNEGEKIGGTADLILVDEFGNNEIIDLKSSVNPTKFNGRYFEDYTKIGENGEEYTNRYDKAFQNNRGSKKEKHEAQLSMYAGMLESRAIPLKGTTILPIHIAETVGDAVTKINVEKQFPLLLNATYLNKTNIDSKHNFRIANSYETEFDQNVNKVVLAVKNEIALLKHIKTENTTYSIKNLERMLKVLENRDFVAASRLALYVTDLHKTFITGDFNLQSKINGLVSEIKGGKITDNREIIQKLLSYKKKVDHFRPLLNDLTEFYDEVGQDHKDPESIISKLGELSEALKHIDSQYKRTIAPFLAENLDQFTDSDEFTKELEKKFDKIQKKIDEYQLELLDINKKTGGVGNNRSKKIEGYISNLKDDIKIGRRTLQTTKEDIINQLKNGIYEDISFAQTWAMAPQDAPNVFVAGASIIIDNNDNELRQHLMELQEEFLPVYKEYARTREGVRNNPKEFNDGLFEIITLGYFDPISKEFIERQEVAYVQKTDITKFNKEKKEFQESIKDIEDRAEYWKKLNDWYSLNTKPISASDEIINGVVIKQGYLSVIADKMEDVKNNLISQKQFSDWKMSAFKIDKYGNIVEVRNDTKEGKELREPNDKYINDKWLAIQNGDKAKLNFYNMLIAQAHKSRQLLPQQLSQEEKYILPYNNKIGLEKAQDGIKKFAKDKWDRAFNEVGSDVKMQYGETTESGLKVIPTMYTSKIALEDVSLDLAQSTLLFAKEALHYEARVKLEPLMSALQIAIATNKPKKTDSKGRLVLKKFAEELNLPGLDAYVDSSESNIEAFFKYYIDHTIYGVSREKSMVNVPILGETDLHSVVDTLSAVIANTSMGLPFGLFSNVANYLQGGAQNIIEANALQFTDKATLAWANKEYASFTDDFVKDVVDPIPETFIGQLIEIIDPFMGEFKDRFGRKISKSQARILMNSSPLMFLQSLSEHNVQLTMMLAMMKNTKLKDEQGLDTNLYDVYKNAWNPETKKIEIKSNILSQLGSTTSNGLLSNTFKNKLSYVLQSTHGNYSKMTAPMANKFWYSRVIKFMRNFFANAVAKRWRGERKNFRVMDITEGYNRTFYRLMRKEFSEMVKVGFGFHTSKDGVFNSILGTDTSTLTPKELANLRRNAMDMAFILSTSLIMMLLTHMLKNAGDDDEKRRITMLLAPVMRLNAELSAFGQIGNPQKGFMLLPDVGDISRNLSNPTVMYGYIKKTVSFVEQIPKDITNLVVEGDFQRYENNSSYWKKGQSKLFTKGIKLFGASPSKMDLGESIKALNMQQNR